MKTKDCVVIALDGMGNGPACDLIEVIGPHVYAAKIHDLIDDQGPEVIDRLKAYGARRVWADMKLHDIPATVEKRAKMLAKRGAGIITVHASGGVEMMSAALQSGVQIYAVTVLTSLDESEVKRSYGCSPIEAVIRLADMAREAGVHGIVCSPQDIIPLRRAGITADLITPGVRSPSEKTHDQARVGTPRGALASSAKRIVVGRPITEASDPVAALAALEAEIADL